MLRPPVVGTLDGFHDSVVEAMRAHRVPGMVVAVISGEEEVAFSQAFGLRDVAQSLPMTPNSVVAIGSASKAFTTLSLGMLVDEGKLEWDRPVREYLPEFRMKDPFASERMTPRDLVCHRSGLAQHDMVWYGTTATREEIVSRVGYLEPKADFRTTFQYQNMMFIIAGQLVSKLAGCSWDEFVQERIFGPLGMTSSNTSVTATQRTADYALPYLERGDEVMAIPFRNIDNAGPAGSINSTIVDMAQWVRLQLAKGRFRGRQLVSEANLAEMHTTQMVIPIHADPLAALRKYPEFSPATYGLGWFLQTYRGHPIVHHGGSIDGFLAFVSLMPRQGFGAVVLSNLGGSMLPPAIVFDAFDRLLGLGPSQWTQRLLAERIEEKTRMQEALASAASGRVPGTSPSHAIEAYVGEFVHPAYGGLSITRRGAELEATLGSVQTLLEHFHYDQFRGRVKLPAEAPFPVLFHADRKGEIGSVAVTLEPTLSPILFTRVA